MPSDATPKRPRPGRPNDAPYALVTRIVKLLEAEPARLFRAREISTLLREQNRELTLRASLRSLHNEHRIVRIARGLYQATPAADARRSLPE